MPEELQLQSVTYDNSFDFKAGYGLGGFFGFCIHLSSSEFIRSFLEYHLAILQDIEKSFYHDEGISLNYMKFKNETVVYLHHYGCNFIQNEMSDALCTSNLCDRRKVEHDIYNMTLGTILV
jgi:hypothetical protein